MSYLYVSSMILLLQMWNYSKRVSKNSTDASRFIITGRIKIRLQNPHPRTRTLATLKELLRKSWRKVREYLL